MKYMNLKYYKYIGLIFIFFLFYFYRKPNHSIYLNNFNKVFSPAYGRVMEIRERKDNIYIAIFLSPFDIHYQFIPINGEIIDYKYDNNGKFELAYNLNKSKYNEKTITKLKNMRGIFYIYQIAGFLVRRIENYKKINDKVKTGQTLGLIHFGSRVDLIVPKKDFILKIKKNQYLNGPDSIIGIYK